MIVRDWYINVLEKRASEDDSAESAHEELAANRGDQASQLKELFSQAGSVEKTESKLVRKNFPEARKADDTTSSSTLLKVAMNKAFFEGARETAFMKLADPEYLRVAFQGFEDEISKIAKTIQIAEKAVPGLLNLAKKYRVQPKAHPDWVPRGTRAAIKGIRGPA